MAACLLCSCLGVEMSVLRARARKILLACVPVKSSELAALSEHAGKSSQGESCRTLMLLADQYERRRALQARLWPRRASRPRRLRLPALLPNSRVPGMAGACQPAGAVP